MGNTTQITKQQNIQPTATEIALAVDKQNKNKR